MYQNIFYIGIALTVIFLFVSVILFVKNDVAKLIGIVTGSKAKKAIKKINENNAGKISKETLPKPDKATDVLKPKEDEFDPDAETDILRVDEKIDFEDEFNPDAETDVLRSNVEEDDFYSDAATDILRADVEDYAYEEINIFLDEGDSILDGAVEYVAPPEDRTRKLSFTFDKLSEKQKDETILTNHSLPDIFEIEEDTTVTHTENEI